jgi:hypothetical protein
LREGELATIRAAVELDINEAALHQSSSSGSLNRVWKLKCLDDDAFRGGGVLGERASEVKAEGGGG